MLFLVWSIVLVAIATVEGVDRKRLAETPRPKPLFDVKKYTGMWYMQTQFSPTSWGIANMTDSVSFFSLRPDQELRAIESWRVEHCNYLTYVYTPTIEAGVYDLKDSIGDLLTGKSIVVDTDYVSYAIVWGCPKGGPNGTCVDPYVRVLARSSFPSSFTMLTIQYVLHNKWAMYLNDMAHISQVNPCKESQITGQGTDCMCEKTNQGHKVGKTEMATEIIAVNENPPLQDPLMMIEPLQQAAPIEVKPPIQQAPLMMPNPVNPNFQFTPVQQMPMPMNNPAPFNTGISSINPMIWFLDGYA